MNLDELEKIAREEARKFQHKYIRTEHLLLALLRLEPENLDIEYDEIAETLREMPIPTCGAEEKLILTEGASRAVAHAEKLSGGRANVSYVFVWAGIVANSAFVTRLLSKTKRKKNDE